MATPPVSPERWQRIEAVLDAVLDAPPDRYEALLDQLCGDDTDLRQRVTTLLRAHHAAGDYLEAPADRFAAPYLDQAAVPPPAPDPGQQVGAYRLVREIGRGGMGVVYLADRVDGQFDRQVALKLVRRGLEAEALVQRFLRERQILAHLQHPNIAYLLDGGLTEDGRPYLVMEYVDGQPITDYCEAHRLHVAARLRLFENVCAAVDYAHRNLVIHRDLKPSNILVTPEGQVKLLDFGIAKLLAEDDLPGEATMTVTGAWAMTPEYAAPEQVRGEPITTETDVYALGIVLYELLAGERPYTFEQATPSEIERVICETTPPRPSTALQRQGAAAPSVVHPKRLRGDLDMIVMKALRKEPERRYNSAAQLLDDVQRYRVGLPVQARPDTVGYRLNKFVQRHRLGVLATAMFVILIIGFGVLYTLRVQAERDRARAEAATADAVTAFMADIFEEASPIQNRGDTLNVYQMLEQGTERVGELEGQPEVQAQLLDVISEVHQDLGLFDEAFALAQRALERYRALHGPYHASVAQSLYRMGATRRDQGRYADSERLLREALAVYAHVADEEDEQTAGYASTLGWVLYRQGQYEEADSLFRRALTLRKQVLGDDHRDVAISINDLASLALSSGDFVAAETLYQDALGRFRRLLGDDHSFVAILTNNLAMTLNNQDKLAEAESLYAEALQLRRAIYGEKHPYVASSLTGLGSVRLEQGHVLPAIATLERAASMRRELLGEQHPLLGQTLNVLADAYERQGRLAEAIALRREVLAIYRAALGDDNSGTLSAQTALAETLVQADAYQEAERLLRDALDRAEQDPQVEDESLRKIRVQLASLYGAWGKPALAARYDPGSEDASQ